MLEDGKKSSIKERKPGCSIHVVENLNIFWPQFNMLDLIDVGQSSKMLRLSIDCPLSPHLSINPS